MTVTPTRAEWQQALFEIARFAEESFPAHCDRAADEFWGAWPEVVGGAVRDLLETHEVNAGLLCFSAIDLPIEGRDRTVCQSLLDQHAGELAPGCRRAVELLATSRIGAYEVLWVSKGRSLRVRPVAGGDEFEAEGFENTDCREGELIATRIVWDGKRHRLVGDSYDLSQSVLHQVREASSGETDSRTFFNLWLQSFLDRGLVGASLSPEGFESWFVRYTVNDEDRLREALADPATGATPVDDGRWQWTPPTDAPASGKGRGIDIVLRNGLLLVAVPTEDMVVEIRRRIEGAASDALAYRETVYRNLTQRSAGGAQQLAYPPANPDCDGTHRLRVKLLGIEPAIWRTIEVPSDFTLGELHDVLVLAFQWRDQHLHMYHAGNLVFGPNDDAQVHVLDEDEVRVGDVLSTKGAEMVWEYDLGDSWRHRITVEEILDEVPERPRIVAGERSSPPEDCGGPPGYARLLAILADSRHDEFDEMRAWAGDLQPEAFDLGEVDRQVGSLA